MSELRRNSSAVARITPLKELLRRFVLVFIRQPLPLTVEYHRAQFLNVTRQHRQRNVTLKTVNAMVEAGAEAMDFQRIDGRFNDRVLFPRFSKLGVCSCSWLALANLPFWGRTTCSISGFSSCLLPRLWKPLSRLQAWKFGNSACGALTIGTARLPYDTRRTNPTPL